MVYALYGRGTLSAKGAKMAPSYIICSLAPTPIYDGETGTVPPRILVVHPRPGLPARHLWCSWGDSLTILKLICLFSKPMRTSIRPLAMPCMPTISPPMSQCTHSSSNFVFRTVPFLGLLLIKNLKKTKTYVGWRQLQGTYYVGCCPGIPLRLPFFESGV